MLKTLLQGASVALALAVTAGTAPGTAPGTAFAQDTIKIGEINHYKRLPAFAAPPASEPPVSLPKMLPRNEAISHSPAGTDTAPVSHSRSAARQHPENRNASVR